MRDKLKVFFSYIDLDATNADGDARIVLGFEATPRNEELAKKLFAQFLEVEIVESKVSEPSSAA